ncbi:Hypothetical predicted protein, partial [Podarcis lilfordi]
IVQKGIRSPDRRDIVLKLKLSTQEPHPPSQPKLPGLSTPATEKHDQSGPSHLASSEERDLISSYGELPLVEQQEVINRLDTLKQQLTHVLQEKISSNPGHSNLLNQRNAVIKGLTPQKPLPITGTPITDDMAVCLAEAPHTPSQRRPSSPLLIDLQSTTSSLVLKSNMPNTIYPGNLSMSYSSMPDLESSFSAVQADDCISSSFVSQPRLVEPLVSVTSSSQYINVKEATVQRDSSGFIEDPAGHINQITTPSIPSAVSRLARSQTLGNASSTSNQSI